LHYVPYGRWRTSPDFLKSARYVAVTGGDADFDIVHHLARFGYRGPSGAFEYRIDGLAALGADGTITPSEPPSGSPLAFCGIAQPRRFIDAVRAFGISPGASFSFADHNNYTADDLADLEQARLQSGCSWYLTTLKDAVRIDPSWFGSTPLRFLRIALHQNAGDDMMDVLTRDH
jgi:tetraacyldisaccharide-1-P 4'-kinase